MIYLETTPQKEQKNFRSGLIWSLLVHVFFLIFFAIKTAFFPAKNIDFTQAVRVDIVGLPEKVIAQSTEPITAPAPTEEPKPALPEKTKDKAPPPETAKQKSSKQEDDGINLSKIKSKQQQAIEKLKALSAIDKIKKDTAAEKANQKIKGAEISAGTDLRGLSKLQHEAYASQLDHHIKQNWALPEWLAKRELKAQVRVFIDSRGNILSRKIIKTSGNQNYDEEVLATIDRSSPFPAPPDKFVKLISVEGILIGFPE